jgi:hypothetical protein
MERQGHGGKVCIEIQAHGYRTLIFSSYKFGAVACGVGAMICDKTGNPIASDVLQSTAYCCSAAAAAVTASQAPNFIAAANKIGNTAVVGYNGVIAGGKLVGQCVNDVCKVVASKVTGSRSLDGPVLSDRAFNVPDADMDLFARLAEPEPESDEDADAVLVSRWSIGAESKE